MTALPSRVTDGSSNNPKDPRPRVLIAEELAEDAAAWLSRHAIVTRATSVSSEFDDELLVAQALIVRTYTQVNEQLLQRAPRLRVVARAGVGLDNIDIAACRSRGIEVVYTPDANTTAVVELVIAFMLDALRPRVFLTEPLALAEWKALRLELKAHRQLRQCTLGIVGMGRVGSTLARAAAGLDIPTIYHDLKAIPESNRHGSTPVESLAQLADQADIISIHVDNRPDNLRLFDEHVLRSLREDCLLINTSRGFVIDHAALATILAERPAMQAILDVHDPEPVMPGSPLLSLPNAQLSPHIGAATTLAHANMSWVVRDVARVLQGKAPEYPAP